MVAPEKNLRVKLWIKWVPAMALNGIFGL